MVDQTTNAPATNSGVGSDLADAGNRLNEERRVLSGTLGEARDAVTGGARNLGDQAVSRIGAEAEGIRNEAAAGLTAFSDALKAASEQLSGKQLGFAGDVVQQAAGGLENLARSLEGRSPAEMLEGIRSFGRQNPVGFIAGSVLAGFAFGRLAAATPSLAGSGSGTGSGQGASGYTPSEYTPSGYTPGTGAERGEQGWPADTAPLSTQPGGMGK